ncbi:MAG: regulator [bacterium]|nr:regulator [bacterium]
MNRITGVLVWAGIAAASAFYGYSGAADVPFQQEYREEYLNAAKGANDARAIALGPDGAVWTATGAGLYVLRDGAWSAASGVTDGPVFDVAVDKQGAVWAAAWDGLYRVADADEKIAAVDGPVSVLCVLSEGVLALGPDGAWTNENGSWRKVKREWPGNLRDALQTPDGAVWIATGVGLCRKTPQGVRLYASELYSSEVNGLALGPDGRLWAGEYGAINAIENGAVINTLTAEDGLPCFDVRRASPGPDGRLWFATALGVARYDPASRAWSLRHSRRWVPSDDARDVAVAPDGTAWIATAGGVCAIRHKTMTLAQKADYFHEICHERHVRAPWFVEKCWFPDPDDKSNSYVRDDDNDGSYTAYYMVMECLRYAATGDPEAKELADKAFDSIAMLQPITGTNGFVARTIIPATQTEMADANRTFTPQEAVESRVRDPRFKPVERRWRPSADGKWLWKGDTSSDEITGHMFGYLFYYDLAADEPRKERVRELVRKVMDYIIEGGYVLKDIDGKATRWGVWSPERLLHDPDWRVESPINAFEILSYLKAAYHITGDRKYQREYETLIEKHGYLELARHPKNYGRSERTHIDDELMMFAAPALLLYEDDPRLLAVYREGLAWAYRTVDKEMNPFYNFMYALMGGEAYHLDDSLFFLRDQPLDLTQWPVDNSTRDDVKLVRAPMLDALQLNRMVPPSERGVMRWDKNPWTTISGDFTDSQGRLESSGVFWLYPYWLGRYLELIDAP